MTSSIITFSKHILYLNNICGGNGSLAHNKLYRNFIILQEDKETHAASGEKALTGYAKIEAKSDKCKISFYAQNLKKEEDYTIVLICYKKDMKQIVDLGSLKVKDGGKGEVSKEYYVNNIAGLDFSYEKISGAAVCKSKEGKLIFSMYGFMSSENIDKDWKKCEVIKHNDKQDSIKEKEEEIHKICKDVKKEKVLQIIKDSDKDKFGDEEFSQKAIKKDCKCSMLSEEEMKKIHRMNEEEEEDNPCKEDKHHKESDEKDDSKCQRENEEHHNCNHKGRNDDHDFCNECDKESCQKNEEFRNEFDIYESKIEEEREIDPYDFELSGAMGAFFQDITSGFEEYRNKFKDIKYCKWYKINVNSLDDMCDITNYNKYTLAYYPMLNYYPYIKKYGSFMMGYKCGKKGDLKYVVYGIPGTKKKEDQPYAGKTGFVTWMDSEEGDLGHWLMFYDYKKSTVVIPTK